MTRTHRESPDSRPTHHPNRRTFLQGLGTAAAGTLAGCEGRADGTTTQTPTSTNTTDSSNTEHETQSGRYRIISETISTLDPIEATDTASQTVIQNIFESLTNYPNGQTNVQNLLAKSVNVEDDVTYSFELKPGLRYSNGDEVTADDLVYAFERLAASDNSNHTSTILGELNIEHETETITIDGDERQQYKPGSLACEAPDQYTFKMTLAKPFHAALAVVAHTCFAALPAGVVGDIDGYEGEMRHDEFATVSPIGSGPFALETRTPDTSVKLTARPMDEYKTLEGPYVEGIDIQIFTKTNPAYEYATINMNADHPSVPSSKYDASKITIEGTDDRGRKYGTYGPLENGLTADYYRTQNLTTHYFGFNCDNVPKFVRRAFAHVYNQQEVTEQVFKGRYTPAYFFTPPPLYPGGANKYSKTATEYPYGHNETQMGEAKTIMEAEGYSADNKYELTMTTYPSSTMEQIARLMSDKLAATHIALTYEQRPVKTLRSRAREGDIECYSLGWTADYPAPDNFLQRLVPSFTQTDTPTALSSFDWGAAADERDDASGWTTAARAAEQAWKTVQEHPLPTETHKQKRNDAYLTIEKANWDDMVLCPAFHPTAEHFDYPWLDKPRAGAMGSSRQKWNRVQLDDRAKYTS